jgi:hypothetical protein
MELNLYMICVALSDHSQIREKQNCMMEITDILQTGNQAGRDKYTSIYSSICLDFPADSQM